jgi:hypothetical protein
MTVSGVARTLGALALLGFAVPSRAAEPENNGADRSTVWTVGISGLASVQPGGYESPNSPYLSRNLGGVRAGAGLSLERRRRGQPLLAVALDTTLPFEELQTGRFVRSPPQVSCPFGSCTAVARHRDTLLSLLAGWRTRSGAVLQAGPTLVFGSTRQGDLRYDDAAGHFAFTAGLEGTVPFGPRLGLAPGARYSYVFRGPSQDFVGLGNHILRLTLGLRVRASKPKAPPSARPART